MSRPTSLGLTFQSTAVFLTDQLSVSLEQAFFRKTFFSENSSAAFVVVPLLTSIDLS